MTSVNPGPATTSNPNTQAPISFSQKIMTIAVAITPVAVAADTSAEQSFGQNGASFATAYTGILPGDAILAVSPPSLTAGTGIVGARVDTATADKFYIEFSNSTAGSLTPASGTWLITVARSNNSNAGDTAGTVSYANFPTSLW